MRRSFDNERPASLAAIESDRFEPFCSSGDLSDLVGDRKGCGELDVFFRAAK